MLKLSIDQKAFFSEFYEKNIYLQRNAFESDVTWKDVNQTIHMMQFMPSYVNLHDGQGHIPESEYVENHMHVGVQGTRFCRDTLHAQLRAGATLILQRLDSVSASVKRYCDFIAEFTGQPVVANGYIAFGEKESFGAHWDKHDVFAVQLIGRKRWRIFPPTFPLPMEQHMSRDHKKDCPDKPVFDDYLNAGDVLYIPRGWWHTAIPTNEETFHVAVGVHPARMAHYATWICQHLLPDYLPARYSLTKFSDDKENLEKMFSHFQELLLKPENLSNFKNVITEYNQIKPEFALQTCVIDRGVGVESALLQEFNTDVQR